MRVFVYVSYGRSRSLVIFFVSAASSLVFYRVILRIFMLVKFIVVLCSSTLNMPGLVNNICLAV